MQHKIISLAIIMNTIANVAESNILNIMKNRFFTISVFSLHPYQRIKESMHISLWKLRPKNVQKYTETAYCNCLLIPLAVIHIYHCQCNQQIVIYSNFVQTIVEKTCRFCNILSLKTLSIDELIDFLICN